ncbi:MAG TPA: hypothetical protein VF133_21235 [Terriglobales bacterium]
MTNSDADSLRGMCAPAMRSVMARVPAFTAVIFFLLFSGPPSFRKRDPMDSLQGVVDWSVLLQAAVWVFAGLWTVYQLGRDLRAGRRIPITQAEIAGLVMIACLAVSIFVSEAPLLTAFKIGQLLISLLFAALFVRRHGISKCIDYIFAASVVLTLAIAVCAFVAPDLVFYEDFDMVRLHGDPIAPLPTVATYALFLLITRRRRLSEFRFWILFSFLSTMLVVSLTRHAWFLAIASLLLYLYKESKSAVLRRTTLLLLATAPFVLVFYVFPALNTYRSSDSIANLTGRTDLWVYLVGITILRSPWIGLGYYSASRLVASNFNAGMGTAHSAFVEVFLGGGLISLIPCLILFYLLAYKSLQCLSRTAPRLNFVGGVLFLITATIALMGGDFTAGEIGITFWSLAAFLPAAVDARHPVSGTAHQHLRAVIT